MLGPSETCPPGQGLFWKEAVAGPSLPLPGILQVAPVVKQRKWGWACFPFEALAALKQQKAGNGAPGGEARQAGGSELQSRAVLTLGPGPPWASAGDSSFAL